MLYIFFELVLQHPSGGSIVHPICYHLYTMGTSDSNSAMADTRPHFTIPFILESDASSIAMGVMLIQIKIPIPYLISARHFVVNSSKHDICPRTSCNYFFMQLLPQFENGYISSWATPLLSSPITRVPEFERPHVPSDPNPKTIDLLI